MFHQLNVASALLRGGRFFSALGFVLGIIFNTSVQAQEDYLSPELRKQVEQLKVEAAAKPTDARNVLERAPIIWEWLNAQSMRGEQFLIDLPLWLSYPIGMPDEPILPLAIRAIDNAIRELQVKEEHPQAIGTITVDSTGPYEVNSHQTIVQTYTVGSLGMSEGGGLLLAHQLMADYGVPQTKDASKADYLTIGCSNPDASFDQGMYRIPSFIHGVYPGTPLSFTLKGTSLNPGDTITIRYGDRSGGSPGFLMQSSENDDFQLPIYVDIEGKRNYFTAEWPGINVVGGDAAGANAVVPSVVAIGETFDLAVRTHDPYYNRASGNLPTYTVVLNGNPIGEIDSTASGSVRMSGLSLDEPGVYRYELRSDDGNIATMSNPVWVQDDPKHRVYWGETHGHTSYAEGQGTVDNFFRYGREDGLLDFIALSEHDAWMDDWEWSTLIDAVDRFNVPNEYVVFLSFEWTAKVEFGGHHNILYRTAPGRERVPVQTAPTLSDMIFGLRENNDPTDLLVIPHAHMPGDWRQNDPQLGKLVEITSMHGTFEWFGNYYLQNGHQIGFVGASDNHEGRPGFSGDSSTPAFQHFGGLGAVLAPEKSSDALFDAMRNIKAYATSDAARIILDAKLNKALMGTRVKFSPKRDLAATVMGTSPIDTIDVIKNGEIVETKRYLTAPLESDCWVKVSFESTSEHGMRDSPRGNRIWNGTIKVANATIEEVSIPGLRNPYWEDATIDPENPDTIIFHNETRGRGNTVLIKLSNASNDTTVKINLDRTMESGITYPIRYRPSPFPKRELDISLGEVEKSGYYDIALEEGRFTDHVGLEIFDSAGKMDQTFSYSESKATTHDDYYYLRVTQLDGSRAWSSPWWVGGDPPR